jgi:DNA-binding NtrC family response regulator
MQTGQILLVDDDAALLRALPRAISLRLSGVEVATADSAQEALELLQEQEYDAIVSDIKLPGMDGLALMAKVYERYPETPVLLITGHSEHNLAIAALKGGAYDYIQKPIDRDDFVVALQRALQTRQLRRQIQEQQRALEQYALSLERLVEQRTRELAVTNAAKERFLSVASQEVPLLHTNWQAVTQAFAQHLQRTDEVEEVRWRLEDMGRSIRQMERLADALQDTSLPQVDQLVLPLRWTDEREGTADGISSP